MTELKNTPAPGLNTRGTPTPFVRALIKHHSLAASVVCTDCAASGTCGRECTMRVFPIQVATGWSATLTHAVSHKGVVEQMVEETADPLAEADALEPPAQVDMER